MFKVVKDFINYCKTFKRFSENTIKNYKVVYKQLYNYLSEVLGEKTIDDSFLELLEEKDIEHFFAWLEENNGGLSQATINQKLSALDSLFSFLYKREIINKIPVKDIERKTPPHREDVPLSIQEVNKLISNANYTRNPLRNKAIVALLFAAGLRISELCKLDKVDIYEDIDIESPKEIELDDVYDFDEPIHMIHIKEAKEYKDRMVFIPDEYYRCIKQYLNIRDDNKEALFLSERKNRIHPDSIRKMLNKISDGIDKNVHPHAFRKAYATYLLNKDVPLEIIADNLGHATSEVTNKVYAKYQNNKRASSTLKAFG
ncbi:MAG: tyrosine-type recombinase/integrase [Bacteroidales bacterium]